MWSPPPRTATRSRTPSCAPRWRCLPERQRLAVFLRYYADLDYAAIGEALGIRTGTVAATLNAAHVALRARLEEVRT